MRRVALGADGKQIPINGTYTTVSTDTVHKRGTKPVDTDTVHH